MKHSRPQFPFLFSSLFIVQSWLRASDAITTSSHTTTAATSTAPPSGLEPPGSTGWAVRTTRAHDASTLSTTSSHTASRTGNRSITTFSPRLHINPGGAAVFLFVEVDTVVAASNTVQTCNDCPLCAVYRSELQESAGFTPHNLAFLDRSKSLRENLFKYHLRNVLGHAFDKAQWGSDGQGCGVCRVLLRGWDIPWSDTTGLHRGIGGCIHSSGARTS